MPALASILQSILVLVAMERPESTPERLHRKGVHCMEVLERTECAVENFEALLGEREAPRDLVTDGMLRLLKIYGRSGDETAIRTVLRRYWDVGMKRRSLVHLPYSVRYFPADIDVLVSARLAPWTKAPIWAGIRFDIREFALTCDPARRAALIEAQQRRIAQRRAAREGRPEDAVYREDRARAEAQRANYEQRRPTSTPPDPIFAEGTCRVAQALGASDLRAWTSVTGGFHHADPHRSIAAFGIPDLERKLAGAVASGALTPVAPRHWRIPGATYAGQPMDVIQLDLDELVLVRADMAPDTLLARRQNRMRLASDLKALAEGIPRDADALVVLTSRAAIGLGMQGLRPSARNMLSALLPRPKGVQIALQIDDQIALFTRVPIDKGAQGQVLVQLARSYLAQRGRKDPKIEAWLRNLDLAQAKDRRALLASYIVTAEQIRIILGE